MEWEKRSAFVFIRCLPGKTDRVFNLIREWNKTIGVFTTAGQWSLMAWIDAEDIEESYEWIAKMRCWPEVQRTSTHQTFHGYRREDLFWDKPAYSWIKIRSNDVHHTFEELKNIDWIASVSSVPGDWDCVAMIYGETYEEIFTYIWDFVNTGYEIEYFAPLKAFWNRDYLVKWTETTA